MSKVESIEDLLKQQTELQAKIEKIRSEEKSKVIEELKKQISIYNLVPSDLFEIKIPSGFFKTDEDEEGKRKRRTKEEKEAEEKAKHDKSISDAKEAFKNGIQVRKFHNEETGVSKYYWNGKKGIKPKGKNDVVVKTIEEIV